MAAALALTASVIDSETSFILSASGNILFGPPMGFGTVSAREADFKSVAVLMPVGYERFHPRMDTNFHE
jgi:hypothetical protein